MCGRYAQYTSAPELAGLFDVEMVTPLAEELSPSWNVSPTQAVRIIHDTTEVSVQPTRVLELAKWGLIPPWAKEESVGARMINARSETVTEKPSFRGPIRHHRCLIVADGYYEWQAAPAGRRLKTPHYIYRRDNRVLALAGLYSLWRGELLTCTILTRAARPEMAHIHDREPCQVADDAIDQWLNPQCQDGEEALGFLAQSEMAWHVVSTEVNATRNNSPHLLDKVEE
ncbi:MAG: SOS response-associated peptidase [Bowdeniella nasicola]|nr:SOS response-associated peptidase [Bowdeniella nasicola]